MIKLVIFASGNGSNFENIAQACLEKKLDCEVVALITNNPSAKVIERAKKYKIKTLIIDNKNYQTREEYEKEIIKNLKELNFEYICLAGYMRIFTPLFVREYPNKIINIHPSLLPKYKGINALEQALENNEKIIGCTTHFVTEELDDGKILIQKSFNIEGMNYSEIETKLHNLEHEVYIETLKKIKLGEL